MRLFIATLCLGLAAAPSAMAGPRAGDRCRLNESIALTGYPGGGHALRTVAAGETIDILKVKAAASRVKVGAQEGFMDNALLTRACAPVANESKGSPANETAPVPASPSPDEPQTAVAPEPPSVTATSAASTAPVDAPVEIVAQPAAPSPGAELAAAPGATKNGPEAFADTYKIKVAVMSLVGSKNIPPELLVSLTNAVPETLEAIGPFAAISSEEVKQILAYESQKMMLGCDDESCMAEIGDLLGADFVVSGGVTRVGETTIIQLQLMNIKESRVDQRISREYIGPPEGLFDALRGCTKQLVREILGQHSGFLRVEVSEEAATVSVNGSIVGTSPLPEALTLAGGSHNLAVEKRGFVLFRRDYTVEQDRTFEAKVVLQPSTEYITAYRERTGLVRALAWVGLATGGALLATSGIILGATAPQAARLKADVEAFNAAALRASDEHERLTGEQRALGAMDAAVTATFIIGLASAGTGALLLFLGDDPSRYDELDTRTSGPGAQVSIGFTVFGLSGTF